MSIADQSCAPSTERSDFAASGLARIFVGAGALDSPFLGAARFEFIQTMRATKGRPYKKIIAARRYHNSSFLTRPNDKIYKKLIKFFGK